MHTKCKEKTWAVVVGLSAQEYQEKANYFIARLDCTISSLKFEFKCKWYYRGKWNVVHSNKDEKT